MKLRFGVRSRWKCSTVTGSPDAWLVRPGFVADAERHQSVGAVVRQLDLDLIVFVVSATSRSAPAETLAAPGLTLEILRSGFLATVAGVATPNTTAAKATALSISPP
jgi:hypothetical protein